MPVSIDEVTAEVEPPIRSEVGSNGGGPAEVSPEAEWRKFQENLALMEIRAARVFAD